MGDPIPAWLFQIRSKTRLSRGALGRGEGTYLEAGAAADAAPVELGARRGEEAGRPPAVRRGEQASPGFDFFFFHVIFYSRAILNLLANFFFGSVNP